eukprot:scaffold86726_cov25-Prasinocladus_malaysianus.AAC.1
MEWHGKERKGKEFNISIQLIWIKVFNFPALDLNEQLETDPDSGSATLQGMKQCNRPNSESKDANENQFEPEPYGVIGHVNSRCVCQHGLWS